ncbi:ABC transporter substrate-binding protein [Kribbella sp. CA-293567]|uniref:ABC transporter substrate-binding protein n=1 Tax=Kribbella sp. CA-293567 TaxID=3002436 RepID=UPI0022DD9263|nr:ABC transporter substrate-binding protein [Kribbella sp. CA-293567]WBQ06855.1 ABC transporter substrate-binding protein [Kribbella sp. CA-293567]
MTEFESVEGFGKLIETVDELYARPRRRCRYADTPPILGCVVAPEGTAGGPDERPDPIPAQRLVEAIARRLEAKDGKTKIPYAKVLQEPETVQPPASAVLAELGTADVLALQEVLAQIADKLAVDTGGSYRFPRFWLLSWLMKQELSTQENVKVRRRELRDLLYHRSITRASHGGTAAGDLKGDLPVWVRVLWVVLLPLYFWARHSGTVPGIGRSYRWFLRQNDVAPGNGNFFELALRLTKDQWTTEKAEQVARLLVNAFLEDLREDFRGAGWIHRYHTTFPTVLLGRISRRNGGYTLLRMVAEVRNDLRLFDPLLLITTGNRVPPLAMPPRPKPQQPAEKSLLASWRERRDNESRQREIKAWLIDVTVGQPADEQREQPVAAARTGNGVRQRLLRRRTAAGTTKTTPPTTQPLRTPPKHLHRVPRPWWRTRRGGALIGFVVLAVSFGSYAGVGYADNYRHCGDGFTWLGVEPATTSVTRIDGTCIGVTDGSNELLLPGSAFDEVRSTIYAQNQRSSALSKSQPDRPLITLVFMSSAADQGSSDGVMTAEREQLAGMAVAQAVQLNKAAQAYEPLLRVLIANAGPQLRQGERVANQLGRMAAADPSIVAVVGMVQSRESTATTIRALAAVGLPTVAATLTADTMVQVSKLYFQISPQNAREAKVAARHVSQLLAKGKDPFGRPLARKATIYKSDDLADTYSQNLAADLKLSLAERGIPVRVESFTPAGRQPATLDAGTAGSAACDAGGVVLYAARGLVDFPAFIAGIADHCRSQPPYVLAGDDVTTYVADRAVSGANKSVPFQYLSLALAPELSQDPPPAASDFYQQLDNLFPYEKSARGRTLDGHAALNYDAAYTVVLAVSYLRRDRVAINGGTVWTALQSVTDAGGSRRAYQGVTGRIDFGGTIGRRVPLNKPITIVTFRNGQPVPAANLVCGGPRDPETQAWCPFD